MVNHPFCLLKFCLCLLGTHPSLYFLSCIFLLYSIWMPSGPRGRDCLFQGQLIPQDNQPVSEHAILMPPNASRVPSYLLMGLSHTMSLFPLSQVTPGHSKAFLYPKACWNYSKQPILHCLLCLAWSFCGNSRDDVV